MQQLFSEFKPASAADWKSQIIKELKAGSFESLTWQNENGFGIEPFYTAEILHHDYQPAFSHTGWEISITAKGTDQEMNHEFLEKLNHGATSIYHTCGTSDPAIVLKNVQLDHIRSVFFVTNDNVSQLLGYLRDNYGIQSLNTCLVPERFNSKKGLLQWCENIMPVKDLKHMRVIGVNALPYHNQNCTAAYEIAVIFSMLVEFLEAFTPGEIPKSEVVVVTGVNSDYFVQMAKLRAIRRLWYLFRKEYKITNDLYIIAETSLTDKSISDSYNNLLRTTVEAMAAVSGGCNELVVHPFDVLFPVNTALSERMAINQQLILKEECYFDKIADVGCGSYFIETLTDKFAERALEIFKRFETEGGFFECLEKNIFPGDILVQSENQNAAIQNGERLAVGVNKFRNEKENIFLSDHQIEKLRQIPIHNPLLNYELSHFFKLDNA